MTKKEITIKGKAYPIEFTMKTLQNFESIVGKSFFKEDLEIINNRIVTYHNQTEPLIEYYGKVEKYHEIDGCGTIDEVQERIFSVMDKF